LTAPWAAYSVGTMKLLASILFAFVLTVARGAAPSNAEWSQPIPPFRIADNLYYVGTRGLANYLITTPEGHILINSDLEENVPMIRASVEQLGFKFTDIKILVISHAHWDHNAGSAQIKELTGAKYFAMEQDVKTVETGGRADPNYGHVPTTHYPATKVDRVLHDGDEVRLGGARLVARLTPGHTPGCTTWTMRVTDGAKTHDAVILGSPNVNEGYQLVNHPRYPTIAQDYAKCFEVLKSLPCDLFLGAHGEYFGMLEKLARVKPGAANPFIDPAGYRQYVETKEKAFRAELERQTKSKN
jgi:metallo-beta-lactamase class B